MNSIWIVVLYISLILIVAILASIYLPPLMLRGLDRVAYLLARSIKSRSSPQMYQRRIQSEDAIKKPSIVKNLFCNSPSHKSRNKAFPKTNSVRNFNHSNQNPLSENNSNIVSNPVVDKPKHDEGTIAK